jgi:sugar lactone lactonase YvrE
VTVRTGRRGEAAAVFLILIGSLLAACAGRSGTTDPAGPLPVWPPPPDAPRIAWVRAVHAPADLGIRRNGVVRFFEYLVRGRRVDGMARPYAVTSLAGGGLAVADPDARVVHLFDPGRVTYRRLAEAEGGPLVSPVGVAADGQGRIYVADSVRAAVFRFAADGKWLNTFGGGGALLRPTGLAFDRERGILYVVDTLAHRVVGFDDAGRRVFEAGRRGSGEGEFNYPVSVALDRQGNLYVGDTMNFRVQVLDGTGRFLRAFGQAGRASGRFDKTKGIALDRDGHVYVVEGLHDVIQVFDPDGTLLTVIGGTGSGPGEFDLPAGIDIDDDGRIVVADTANRRIQILRYLGDTGSAGSGS